MVISLTKRVVQLETQLNEMNQTKFNIDTLVSIPSTTFQDELKEKVGVDMEMDYDIKITDGFLQCVEVVFSKIKHQDCVRVNYKDRVAYVFDASKGWVSFKEEEEHIDKMLRSIQTKFIRKLNNNQDENYHKNVIKLTSLDITKWLTSETMSKIQQFLF